MIKKSITLGSRHESTVLHKKRAIKIGIYSKAMYSKENNENRKNTHLTAIQPHTKPCFMQNKQKTFFF